MSQDLQDIKERIDIVDLISSFVIFKHQGRDWFGVCPFHADKDPSFSVSKEKQMYFCFGCRAGGDIFDFWMAFHQVSFPAAVVQLCERYGLQVPENPRRPDDPGRIRSPQTAAPHWDPRQCAAPSPAWVEHASRFVAWSYEQLFESPEALSYLTDIRGLREDTLATFALGWNSGGGGKDLYRVREAWGLLKQVNEKTGKPRALWLPIGWVIPWFSKGRLQRVRIRRKDRSWGPPYYVIDGSAMAAMVIPARSGDANPWASRTWCVVESELDAILVHQEAGDLCGVIASGSSTARPDIDADRRLREAVHILVSLDNDDPGKEASVWWAETYKETQYYPVTAGKDPAEAWKQGINLREWIMSGLPEGLRAR